MLKRYALLLLLLAAALTWAGGTSGNWHIVPFVGPASSGGGSLPTGTLDIANGVAAGDKSGNWWLLHPDAGSDPSAPTASIFRWFRGGNNGPNPTIDPLIFGGSQEIISTPGGTTSPSTNTSFSVVTVLRFSDLTQTMGIVGKVGNSAQDTYFFQTNTSGGQAQLLLTITKGSGSTFSTNTTLGSIVTGVWYMLGAKYDQTSGDLSIRITALAPTPTAGVTTTSNAGVNAGLTTYNTPQQIGLYAPGGGGWNSHYDAVFMTYGFFFTEKILSDADMDRIGNAAMIGAGN